MNVRVIVIVTNTFFRWKCIKLKSFMSIHININTNLYSFAHHQNKIMSSLTVEEVGGFLWIAIILSLILSLILYCCFIKLKEENEEVDVYSRQINRLRTHKCECLRCQRKKH